MSIRLLQIADPCFNSASLTESISVECVFLLAAPPGSQSFEVFDAGFAVIESGFTVPIPEPAAALLVGVGFALL